MKDLLLVTPPFTQLNTPYPATAYLKGFLNTKDIPSFQIDLGIEVILKQNTKNDKNHVFHYFTIEKYPVYNEEIVDLHYAKHFTFQNEQAFYQ